MITIRDGIGVEDLAAWAGWATVLGSFLWVSLIRPARSLMRAWDSFMADWAGIPERPGHDLVPGIPERLRRIEREVQRDGGRSLKDVAWGTSRKLDQFIADQNVEHAAISAQIRALHTVIEQKEPP